MSELLELGERILGKAEGSGEIELYMVSDRSTDVTIQRSEINMSRFHVKELIGIRVLHDNRLGFASVNSLDESLILEKLDEARSLARHSLEDENNVIPSPGKVSHLEGLYDPGITDFTLDDSLAYAQLFIDSALETDARFSLSDGFFSSHDTERAVVSTLGTGECERSSLFLYMGMGMAVQGEEISNLDARAGGSRDIDGIRVEEVAGKLVESTVGTLGAERGESFRGPGILSPSCLGDMLLSGLMVPLKGNRVLKGMSPLADMVGERIASPGFTLRDSSNMPHGLGNRSFDREGMPTPELTIVDGGILMSHLHNSYTSHALKVPNTGHASGGPRSVPVIAPSNLVMEPGDSSLESMVRDIPRGILINRFSGEIDPVSGNFSGVVKGGKFVREGEIKHPLKNMMVSGNIFHMLKGISGVSKDVRRVLNNIHMELPYVLVDDLSFTSG